MKEHKKQTSKFWAVMWIFAILCILGIAIYSNVTAPTYVPVTATTTSEVITTSTTTATSTVPVTQYVTKTITVSDPKLQAQIDTLENEIATLQQQNAQLRAQQPTAGSSNNSVIINNPATSTPVVKTQQQLQAQYSQAHQLPDCNNRVEYPYTGHEQGDCDRDIQAYYANETAWVNQQLANQ